MGYRLKKGAAEGIYANAGHSHDFRKGKDYELNPAQAEAFAHVVEKAKAAKPRKGSK